jgi:hypothetical protein
MTGIPISDRIVSRSVQIVSSTIPPNVTLDEWRQTCGGDTVGPRRLRLLIEALDITSRLKRQVT